MKSAIFAVALLASAAPAPSETVTCAPTDLFTQVAKKNFPGSTVVELNYSQARIYLLALQGEGYSASPVPLERVEGVLIVDVKAENLFVGIIGPGGVICNSGGVPRRMHNKVLQVAVAP